MTRRNYSGNSGNSRNSGNDRSMSHLSSGRDFGRNSSGRDFDRRSNYNWAGEQVDRRTDRARRMDNYTNRRHSQDQNYGRYESQEFTPERNQRNAHFYAADDYMGSNERDESMWPSSSSKVWHSNDNFLKQGGRYSDSFGEDQNDSSSRALWGQEFSGNRSQQIDSPWLNDSQRDDSRWNRDNQWDSQGQWDSQTHRGANSQNYSSQNYAAQNYAGKGPKGYKRSDDRIKEDVCECLERSSQVDASEIEVEVKDACVTLTGKVESRQAKRNAEMLIENLRGVDDVINELKVEKSKDHDTEIDSYPSSANKGSDSLYASGKTGEKINSKFDSNTSKRKESADYSSTRM